MRPHGATWCSRPNCIERSMRSAAGPVSTCSPSRFPPAVTAVRNTDQFPGRHSARLPSCSAAALTMLASQTFDPPHGAGCGRGDRMSTPPPEGPDQAHADSRRSTTAAANQEPRDQTRRLPPQRTVSETRSSRWPGWIWAVPLAAVGIVRRGCWCVSPARADSGHLERRGRNGNHGEEHQGAGYRGFDVGEVSDLSRSKIDNARAAAAD